MKIHDDKRRERIYTHNKTILNKEELLGKLPGWNKHKFNLALEALEQKEVIEITGNEVKIFLLPLSEKEFKNVKNNEIIHESFLTVDESDLLTLLSIESKISQ